MRLLSWSLCGAFLASAEIAIAAFDLGTLGGSYSFARDINSFRQVVGEANLPSEDTHAFLWTEQGMKDLGCLGKNRYCMANGMNDRGQVVGYSRVKAKSGNARAVLWDQGQIVPLPPLRAGEYSQASEINENGEAVGVSGSQAVVWRQRKAYVLENPGGGYSIALGINAKGWIVGNCQTKALMIHACLWVDGKVRDLGTLGGEFSTANAINDAGQIVGSSQNAAGDIHAFLYENGQMKDLGPGMVRNLNSSANFAWDHTPDMNVENLPDTIYSSAFSINDAGVQVGVSEIFSQGMKHSEFHATLWN